MRIAFTSDLHVEHHPELVDLIRARVAGAADVLVVAGDVCPSPDRLRDALSRLRDAVPVLAFVPGNHDLWRPPGSPDSRTRYLDLLPSICHAAGVAYLPSGPLPLGDVTLVGQTGWYDYSLRDPTYDAVIPADAYARGVLGHLAWSDKQFIVWPGCDDDRALTAFMTDRLAADLAAAPRGAPVWVVTHMLPFVELVARRPMPWGFINGFLGATALGSAIVAAAETGLPIVRAISGHTHFRRAATISAAARDFAAETSPIGYPREVERQAPSLADHVAERVRIVSSSSSSEGVS